MSDLIDQDVSESFYEKCLKWICEQDAAIFNYLSVFSCTWIAEGTNIPVRKVRKIMKQLANDGYVFKNSEGGYDEWSEKLYCIHGYSVTEKARKHEYGQKRYQADVAYIHICERRLLSTVNEEVRAVYQYENKCEQNGVE